MTITRGSDGIYCAVCTIDNKPYLGFSPIRQEAIDFCLELMTPICSSTDNFGEKV